MNGSDADDYLFASYMQGLYGASLLPTGVAYTDETAPIPLEDVDVDDSLPSITARSAFVDGKGSFRQVRIAIRSEWQTVRYTAIVHRSLCIT